MINGRIVACTIWLLELSNVFDVPAKWKTRLFIRTENNVQNHLYKTNARTRYTSPIFFHPVSITLDRFFSIINIIAVRILYPLLFSHVIRVAVCVFSLLHILRWCATSATAYVYSAGNVLYLAFFYHEHSLIAAYSNLLSAVFKILMRYILDKRLVIKFLCKYFRLYLIF